MNSPVFIKSNHFQLILTGFLIITILFTGCSENDYNEGVMDNNRVLFGQLEDGRDVEQFTMTNANDIEVKIINYGGIITSLKVPDQEGVFENIVLGFDNLDDYLGEHPYFGALIGRYGNRIENGEFTLDGTEYQLSVNDGNNHLHGGEQGFDKVLWAAELLDDQALKLTFLSEDGEEGYPGNLSVTATYTLTDDNELKIEFEAETDKATTVNLTAHSYFNLTGDPSNTVLDHELKLNAGQFTPVNEVLIPTGEIASVSDSPFDFTNVKRIGDDIDEVEGGYDHNFVLDDSSDTLKLAAELTESQSGRKLSVYTTEPAIQFYSGNFLDGSLQGPDGTSFEQYSGLCLEPQHYPNSPNEPSFPSTILRPGETYESSIVYEFSLE
ncbi:galactose mutarotase [soil metagenome]